MTYTLILLVSRKPGLTLQAFKQHWETIHVPLLKSLVGYDFPLSFTRHYVDRDLNLPANPANVYLGQQDDFNFDAIAVFTFADKAHWERFIVKCNKPEAARMLAEDYEKFHDDKKLRGVFAGETKATGRDGGSVGWRFVGSV